MELSHTIVQETHTHDHVKCGNCVGKVKMQGEMAIKVDLEWGGESHLGLA